MTHKYIERPEYVYENLEQLPCLLKERGMLQQELEEVSNLASHQVSQWIGGYSYPTKSNYNKLAVYLGWRLWE